MKEEMFWFVWKESSMPTRKHKTIESAEKEATRLVGNCPDDTFYVLEALAKFDHCSVRRTELERPEPPF